MFLYPVGELKVVLAPGVEHRSEQGDNPFAFRLAFYYGFPLNERLSIEPGLNIDFVDGEKVLVYGAALAVKF